MAEKATLAKHRYPLLFQSLVSKFRIRTDSNRFFDDPILTESSLLIFKTQGPKRLGENTFSPYLNLLLEFLLSNFMNRTDWIWRKCELHLVLLVFSPWGKAVGQILANVCEQKEPTTVTPRLSSESAPDPSVSRAQCPQQSHAPFVRLWDVRPGIGGAPTATWSWAQAAFKGHWCKWEDKENIARLSPLWALGFMYCCHVASPILIQ